MAINTQASVGPYVGVSRDERKTLTDGRTFRLVLYGAYNAYGLIGSEYNGIVVLDEDQKLVVADNIAKASSGWYGPTERQINFFNKLVAAPDEEFRAIINSHPHPQLRFEV